jgi:hypothetical protein
VKVHTRSIAFAVATMAVIAACGGPPKPGGTLTPEPSISTSAAVARGPAAAKAIADAKAVGIKIIRLPDTAEKLAPTLAAVSYYIALTKSLGDSPIEAKEFNRLLAGEFKSRMIGIVLSDKVGKYVARGTHTSDFYDARVVGDRATVYHCQDGRDYARYRIEKTGEVRDMGGSIEQLSLSLVRTKGQWQIIKIEASPTKEKCHFE